MPDTTLATVPATAPATQPRLTATQRGVLHRMVRGMTRRDIADERRCSTTAIGVILTTARRNFGAETVEQLIARFILAYPDSLTTDPRPFPPKGPSSPAPAPGFGDALYTARVSRGMSQKDLSERADFDHTLISRLEAGKRNPTLLNVTALANALTLRGLARDRFYAAAGMLTPAMARYLETSYFTMDSEEAA